MSTAKNDPATRVPAGQGAGALNGNHRRVEVRDPTGDGVEVFLPEKLVQELLAQRDSLREQVANCQGQIERLSRENARYLQSLHQLLRARVQPVTAEELDALQKGGVHEDELRGEIDRLFPSRARP